MASKTFAALSSAMPNRRTCTRNPQKRPGDLTGANNKARRVDVQREARFPHRIGVHPCRKAWWKHACSLLRRERKKRACKTKRTRCPTHRVATRSRTTEKPRWPKRLARPDQCTSVISQHTTTAPHCVGGFDHRRIACLTLGRANGTPGASTLREPYP